MNLMLATGLFMLVVATANLLDVVRRKGARFEYAGAMFIGELGLMFVAGQIIDSESVGVAVTITFGVSMLVTAVFWWRLFRDHERQASGKTE